MDEIKPLTSLRGVAALAVVMQHFSATAQTVTPQWIPSLVPHGYMAVHFFFVLSGFIMSLMYLEMFRSGGLKAFPEFLVKRVARIVPLNLFTLFMLMIFGLISRLSLGTNIFFQDSSIAFDLPANILMLQGLGVGRNLNGPSWSISTEFAAYFLFPLFIAVVFHKRRWVSYTSLLAALLLLCGLAARMPRLGLTSESILDQVLYCFTEFVLGMGAYGLYRHRAGTGRAAGDTETWLLCGLATAGLAVGIDLPVALLCPFIVVAAALNRGTFARLLSGGVPYFLGLISFSIYLIHDPFRHIGLLIFSAIHPAPVGPITALLFALAGSLAILPLAWLTYIGIERPGRQIVRKWIGSGTTRAAPSST